MDLSLSIETIKNRISSLNLPARFEYKLLNDLKYLLDYNIPDLERIILFGSCARGTMRVTSDLDLLIMTTSALDRLTRGEISSELEDSIDEVGTDVIFYTREQFENSDRLIINQIKQEGILLYEK